VLSALEDVLSDVDPRRQDGDVFVVPAQLMSPP
jgi:hypothetical protein